MQVMQVMQYICVLAVTAILLAGAYDFLQIGKSINWLRQSQKIPASYEEGQPRIIILLPVLREQRIIKQTLQAFARLHYPHQLLHIVVITTEKELAQRKQARLKLPMLARDIASRHLAMPLLVEKYLGVFSEDVLKETIRRAQLQGSEEKICLLLNEAFEAFPTTIDLVVQECELLNLQLDRRIFVHVHYPHTSGNMNQQLEYAVQELPDCLGQDVLQAKNTTYLTIYNADSRPHEGTLQYIAELCHTYAHDTGSFPPVMQQSATYLENIEHMGSNASKLLLQSSAVLQTRWVLAHEIPRLQRQSKSALRYKTGCLNFLQRLAGAEFALCVGHGLFLRYDLAEQLGLFSLNAVCDDLLWSYRLCIDHLPMLPIPLLESAESPTTMKSLLIQKRSWFLGYTEYRHSRHAALQERLLTARKDEKGNRVAIELVTLHGIMRAIRWLLLSPTIALAFVLPLLLHSWVLFALTCLAYTLYGFFTYWLILDHLNTLKGYSGGTWDPTSLSVLRKVGMAICSLPAFLLESVGLWWCLWQRCWWTVTRTPVSKEKTER